MALGEAPEEFERLYLAGEDTRATGTISSNFNLEEQTWNVIENKGPEKLEPGMFMKTNKIVELTWNVTENKRVVRSCGWTPGGGTWNVYENK